MSWRWVPSPQSNNQRSPPRRTSTAGRPRRAVGTLPAVPAKNTDRSMVARGYFLCGSASQRGGPALDCVVLGVADAFALTVQSGGATHVAARAPAVRDRDHVHAIDLMRTHAED